MGIWDTPQLRWFENREGTKEAQVITFDLNWLAILVAVIANMVIGAAWYGGFAEPWMAGIGKTRADIDEAQSWQPYAVAILNSLLMAFVLANVIHWIGVDTWLNGLLTGLLMWLGFTGFSFAANHAFEMRSFGLWGINAGTYMVGLAVMGAILGGWQ